MNGMFKRLLFCGIATHLDAVLWHGREVGRSENKFEELSKKSVGRCLDFFGTAIKKSTQISTENIRRNIAN
ncbi:MAG: hypothetical protein A3D31_16485 [Candidatus Fluviicola riflensis]|nr:MAG: hypothetical protein CHH17_01425 [Candidatus Fluviicola riflensis]OGS76596.1 MAG: hypothetical protein A3D31_16485 [Candidatus Fluviicola riflensis]OGS83049.1 MAG: hypothetical protein A2724_14875 [Fluviicola sp. RIFCSPHIGHO2_01_FULL_43_53]OGS88327.1 MAG: hypothetical protein A3E30_05990 [Fluviicola sp. RIFCSPHIGHO2_12_FULL_43_24]